MTTLIGVSEAIVVGAGATGRTGPSLGTVSLVLDNFNRANQTPLGVSSQGTLWSSGLPPGFSISNGPGGAGAPVTNGQISGNTALMSPGTGSACQVLPVSLYFPGSLSVTIVGSVGEIAHWGCTFNSGNILVNVYYSPFYGNPHCVLGLYDLAGNKIEATDNTSPTSNFTATLTFNPDQNTVSLSGGGYSLIVDRRSATPNPIAVLTGAQNPWIDGTSTGTGPTSYENLTESL